MKKTHLIILCLSSLLLAYYGMLFYKKNALAKVFEKKKEELVQKKEMLLQKQQQLYLEQQSEKDPAWIEMVLKQELGLVPQGQTKVYFPEEEGIP